MLRPKRKCWTQLDSGGYIFSAILIGLLVALLVPFMHWIFCGTEVRSEARVLRWMESERPVGYYELRVLVTKSIVVPYYAGSPTRLDLRATPIPRDELLRIEVEVTDGRASVVEANRTGNAQLNTRLEQVCRAWTNGLRFSFRFAGRFEVQISDNLAWTLRWDRIDFVQPCGDMVAYCISRRREYSKWILPINGLDEPSRVIVPDAYRQLVRRCQDCLGVDLDQDL